MHCNPNGSFKRYIEIGIHKAFIPSLLHPTTSKVYVELRHFPRQGNRVHRKTQDIARLARMVIESLDRRPFSEPSAIMLFFLVLYAQKMRFFRNSANCLGLGSAGRIAPSSTSVERLVRQDGPRPRSRTAVDSRSRHVEDVPYKECPGGAKMCAWCASAPRPRLSCFVDETPPNPRKETTYRGG